MKKSILLKLVVFVLIAGIGAGTTYFMFFNKTDEEKITDRIDAFTEAYNSGDIDACLNCFDSRSKNALKGLTKLGNSVLGFDLSDLFGISVASQDVSISQKVKSITIDSETSATVVAELYYSGDYASKESTTTHTFKMKKEKNNWFIVENDLF